MTVWQFWMLFGVIVVLIIQVSTSSSGITKELGKIIDQFDWLASFLGQGWPDVQDDIAKLDDLETIIYRLDDVTHRLDTMNKENGTPDILKLLKDVRDHTNQDYQLDKIVSLLGDVREHIESAETHMEAIRYRE